MKPTNYFALAAASIDGKIALHSAHFTHWTSAEDTAHLHSLLNSCDVILVGNNTYKTAEAPLSKRNCIVLSRQYNEPMYRMHETLAYYNPDRGDIKEYFESSKVHSVCILGGTQTYSLALEKHMLNEIYLTIEPLIFGTGLPLFSCSTPILETCTCTLLACTQLNTQGTLLLHYQVHFVTSTQS